MLILSTSGPALGQDCLEDGSVRVIAHKFAGDPPSYAFRVENGTDLPIGLISIGHGHEMYLKRDAIRTRFVGSPSGWSGAVQWCENRDCPYMRYLWTPMAADGESEVASGYDIQPGESLTGFSVQLRSDYGDDLWDLRTLPFRVIASAPSFTCYVGIVEDSVGAPTVSR